MYYEIGIKLYKTYKNYIFCYCQLNTINNKLKKKKLDLLKYIKGLDINIDKLFIKFLNKYYMGDLLQVKFIKNNINDIKTSLLIQKQYFKKQTLLDDKQYQRQINNINYYLKNIDHIYRDLLHYVKNSESINFNKLYNRLINFTENEKRQFQIDKKLNINKENYFSPKPINTNKYKKDISDILK